jgi:hypothetical protein
MRIVYKKTTGDEPEAPRPQKAPPPLSDFEKSMRLKAQRRTIKANAERIAMIQEEFPGWMPKINVNEQ